jgi:hypothetical protein
MLLFSIFILVVVVILLLYLRTTVEREIAEEKRVRLLFDKNNMMDCENVQVPCVEDQQCRDNCLTGITKRCERGFCTGTLRITPDDLEECDASRGLFGVLNALDGLVVETLCVSLYRDVIDDNGDLRPYVCEGGDMRINLEESIFSVDDCTCRDFTTKYIYRPGAFGRDIPVCVPNGRIGLFDRVYDRL